MKLKANQSENIMNRRIIMDYFIACVDRKEPRWKTDLFANYIEEFNTLFGPRLQRVEDGERRRLDVWYVDSWEIPFWAISHRDRGTSYEVLYDATDEQCLALIKRMAEELHALSGEKE